MKVSEKERFICNHKNVDCLLACSHAVEHYRLIACDKVICDDIGVIIDDPAKCIPVEDAQIENSTPDRDLDQEMGNQYVKLQRPKYGRPVESYPDPENYRERAISSGLLVPYYSPVSRQRWLVHEIGLEKYGFTFPMLDKERTL